MLVRVLRSQENEWVINAVCIKSALRECCGAQALSWLQMPRSSRAKAFPLSAAHYQYIESGCQEKSVVNV